MAAWRASNPGRAMRASFFRDRRPLRQAEERYGGPAALIADLSRGRDHAADSLYADWNRRLLSLIESVDAFNAPRR